MAGQLDQTSSIMQWNESILNTRDRPAQSCMRLWKVSSLCMSMVADCAVVHAGAGSRKEGQPQGSAGQDCDRGLCHMSCGAVCRGSHSRRQAACLRCSSSRLAHLYPPGPGVHSPCGAAAPGMACSPHTACSLQLFLAAIDACALGAWQVHMPAGHNW